jgi:hypothetical protein
MARESLPDVFGPDQVRVSVAVEPAVERLVRERGQWMMPRLSLLPPPLQMWNMLPALVQSTVLHGAWAVVVEADSGQRLRLARPNRGEALRAATSVCDAVRERGVTALAELRP